MSYLALACYRFTLIENPDEELKRHKDFFRENSCTGRIYISEEGINSQVSGPASEIYAYRDWLEADSRFKGMIFNIQEASENIFPRMTIKLRPQLVALDQKVDLQEKGEYLAPPDFREAIKDLKEKVLIDVRNDYESAIGHFEGAECPPLEQYRDFPAYAEELATRVDKEKTPVLMYCTGGIRCELFSSLLKKMGFKSVYQLQGGILNYGAKVGSDGWKGKVFVFDDRLAIPIDGKENEAIGACSFCKCACDTYYNCANMHCNELFIACQNCHSEKKGACSESCETSEGLRPTHARLHNKPFRRKHLL